MDVFSDVTDGLIKQIKNIRNSKSKWIEIVRTTDEIVTSLAYNLMREQKLIISGIRDDSAWSVKEIQNSPTAASVFLSGDVEGASKIAAAERIESDFDRLETELRNLRNCINTVEKATNSLTALHKLKAIPNTASPSPSKGSRPRFVSLLSWPALFGEARALLGRLQADLQLRLGLMRHIAPCVVRATSGDRAAPQRLCFTWRQAAEVVRWENFTDFGSDILDMYTEL